MTMKAVQIDDLILSYETYGEGEETIICFHGHGKSPEDFLFLTEYGVKIISIHLFLHGKSTFSTHRIYTNLIQASDVEKLLEKLLEQEKIDKFHIMAYSQGGRFVLSILPHFYSRLLTIHLLAVDGLNDKNFYSWSQRRWWARKLFKRWTKRPAELLGISKLLARVKVVHPKIVDFLNYYASDPKKMTLAYKTWAAFRNLRPNTSRLKKTLRNQSVPFYLIIGQHDQIITLSSAEKFLKDIHRSDALRVIDCGHDFFKPEALEKVREILDVSLGINLK